MNLPEHEDHWSTLFDHTYLRWFDLQGEPALVKINQASRKVEMTLPGGVVCRKPVVHLEMLRGKIDDMKPLVLNVTNATSIAQIHGNSVSGWEGKEIVLYPTMTERPVKRDGKLEKLECIRIRARKE